jgi:hypothetical protein
VKASAELLGWQFDPLAPLTALVHHDAGGAEYGQDTSDSEELGQAHDHVRYGTDGRFDDTAPRTRGSCDG